LISLSLHLREETQESEEPQHFPPKPDGGGDFVSFGWKESITGDRLPVFVSNTEVARRLAAAIMKACDLLDRERAAAEALKNATAVIITTCPSCGGDGAASKGMTGALLPCPKCDGKGRIEERTL
jgi:hypothetical protein